jgi:hypothetical protein
MTEGGRRLSHIILFERHPGWRRQKMAPRSKIMIDYGFLGGRSTRHPHGTA